tara:strand:- start:469 stop:726 length:258 start_codon:yes stop_codon:yes gene_type:complete
VEVVEQDFHQVLLMELKDQIQFFQVLRLQVVVQVQDVILLHQVIHQDQGDQEQDKEVKILMEQVYLVETHHQFLHHKEIMGDKVE